MNTTLKLRAGITILATWLAGIGSGHAAPANDSFTNRVALTGTNVSVAGTNVDATKEPGEPKHAGRPGAHSVWYSWTAPITGHYLVLVDAAFAKLLAVYTGTNVTSLTPVVSGFGDTNQVARVGFDAAVGMTFQIAVDGDNGASDYFTLYLMLPPLNDDFANRFTVANTNVSITGSNVGATQEPGEPSHAGGYGDKSVWWTWTAPVAGRVLVSLTCTDLDPALGVYTGTEVTNLTVVASGSAYSPDPAYAAFDATPDTAYEIAVDGRYSATGSYTLLVRYVTAPPNDYFANSLVVTNSPATPNTFYVTGSNFGATKEPGETWQGTASVWWTWTAPTNGEVLIELETYGTTMTFPWLGFYRGTTVSNLTAVYPRVEFAGMKYYHDARYPVTAGTTYHVWAANRGGLPGTYTLRGTFEPPPANDAFANRATLANTPFLFQYGYLSTNAYNVSATKETGEPWHGGASYWYGGKSVWWTWTAPASGQASLGASPIRYTFSSMLGLYTGNAVNSLTRIASCYTTCTSGACGLTIPVTAGTTYQIAVDGGGGYGDSGEFSLSLDVSLDTNAPAVAITNPVGGQAASASLTVSGTASDLPGTGAFDLASGVNLVEVRVNGGGWQAATGTNAWSRALTLAGGVNVIEARSCDTVGNYSAIASVTVTYGTIISRVETPGGVPQITCPTELGKTYQLEWAGDLALPINWQPVTGASEPGTGLPVTLSDTNGAGQVQRFYRLSVF